MQEPTNDEARLSGAHAPVSLNSATVTLDHDVEITPPVSPRLAPTAGENDACLRDRSPSPRPPQQPDVVKKPPQFPASTRLHHSSSMLFLVLIYATIAVLGWVVTCLLTSRPMTAPRYGVSIFNNDNDLYGWSPTYLHNRMAMNQKWFVAVRVLRAVAAVFTLPVASAVCASAAVVFVQRTGYQSRLSMRKVSLLADRAWADPSAYGMIVVSWKRYGSVFLLLAIVLNVLGAVIYPLQEGLLTSKTIKTPVWPQDMLWLVDLPDQFSSKLGAPDSSNLVVALTREALKTARTWTMPSQLWPGVGTSCDTLTVSGELPIYCVEGPTFQGIFGDVLGGDTRAGYPFLAELENGFNTGVIRQFIPRVNSTAQYASIDESDFPTGCDKLPDAFYVQYANATGGDCPGTWALEACMPSNVTQTPWKSTRDRQDFSEELYLNITVTGCDMLNSFDATANNSYFRLAINTTAGYFELPNYMNGGVPGDVLENDPNSLCGSDCEIEGSGDIYDHNTTKRRVKRDNSTSGNTFTVDNNGTTSLESMPNKGPLLTIAMALFGHESFLDVALRNPGGYGGNDYSTADALSCIDFFPMGGIIGDLDTSYCITNEDAGGNGFSAEELAARWLGEFFQGNQSLSIAFTTAAFIANQNWLNNNLGSTGQRTLSISYDMGADTDIPVISRGGIIAVSTIMGLFFAILFAMVFYSLWMPRWTRRLDAFAMLRMGAAMHDKLPLLVGRNMDKVKALDEMPGWVGDAAEDGEYLGRLGLGAETMTQRKKRYASYAGDTEPLTILERREAEKMSAAS